MALTTARMKAALDAGLSEVTHVQWSENGSSESANVARTATTLKAATTANPSVMSNDGALESAAAGAGCTITHFGFSAAATLKTTWIALDAPAVLLTGGKITVADGALQEKLYQATVAP